MIYPRAKQINTMTVRRKEIRRWVCSSLPLHCQRVLVVQLLFLRLSAPPLLFLYSAEQRGHVRAVPPPSEWECESPAARRRLRTPITDVALSENRNGSPPPTYVLNLEKVKVAWRHPNFIIHILAHRKRRQLVNLPVNISPLHNKRLFT